MSGTSTPRYNFFIRKKVKIIKTEERVTLTKRSIGTRA